MKKIKILLPVLLAGMLSCNNGTNENTTAANTDTSAIAEQQAATETPPPPPMDSATMMKKMQDYGTPGEMHKMLASANGTWDADVTSWMDPAKPPIKSKATSENKMIMNGLYQSATFKGDRMGMPFEGMSMVGYDNTRKVFTSTWIDNMSSGIMYTEGIYDPQTKTITFKGKMTDCTTDGQCDVRETMTFTDDKHQHMEMYYAGPDGKEMKAMEINYTKK